MIAPSAGSTMANTKCFDRGVSRMKLANEIAQPVPANVEPTKRAIRRRLPYRNLLKLEMQAAAHPDQRDQHRNARVLYDEAKVRLDCAMEFDAHGRRPVIGQPRSSADQVQTSDGSPSKSVCVSRTIRPLGGLTLLTALTVGIGPFMLHSQKC